MHQFFYFLRCLRQPGCLRNFNGKTVYLSFELVALVLFLVLRFRRSLDLSSRYLLNKLICKFIDSSLDLEKLTDFCLSADEKNNSTKCDFCDF